MTGRDAAGWSSRGADRERLDGPVARSFSAGDARITATPPGGGVGARASWAGQTAPGPHKGGVTGGGLGEMPGWQARGPLGGVAAGVPGRVPVLAAIARLGRTAPAGRVAGSGLPSWWPCHGLSFPRSRVHQRPLRAAGRSELYTRQKAPSAINDRHPARRVEKNPARNNTSCLVRCSRSTGPGGSIENMPGPRNALSEHSTKGTPTREEPSHQQGL